VEGVQIDLLLLLGFINWPCTFTAILVIMRFFTFIMIGTLFADGLMTLTIVKAPKHFSLRGGATVVKKLQTRTTALKSTTATSPKSTPTITNQSLAGLTVALASLPTSLTFATIAKVDPLVALWTTAITAVVSSLTGVRPGVMFGAAGVVAVPIGTLVGQYGTKIVAPTILLSTLFTGLFGIICKCTIANNTQAFEDFVSSNVMNGFMNSLGFVLLRSQLAVFCLPGGAGLLPKTQLIPAAAIAASVAMGTKLLPRSPIPNPIIMLVVSSVLCTVFSDKFGPVKLLGSLGNSDTFDGGVKSLPKLLPVSAFTEALKNQFGGNLISFAKVLAPVAAGIGFITVLETLLAKKLVDEKVGADADADAGKDVSVLSQTVSNIVSCLFGGFGGCGLIPQTVLNLSSGGSTRVSGLAFGLFFGLGIVLTAPLLSKIPLAALAGVMLAVCYDTIQAKSSWKMLQSGLAKDGEKSNAVKLTALILTTFVGVEFGFAAGILSGVSCEKILGRQLRAKMA